jgi:protein involved in polysaccharide export with SLBB domain
MERLREALCALRGDGVHEYKLSHYRKKVFWNTCESIWNVTMPNIKKRFLLLRVALVSLVLMGCSSVNSPVREGSNRLSGSTIEKSDEQATQAYVLQNHDVVEIKFAYESQLNELVTIRPDGMISLQLIDEVKAAGLTPAELDSTITEKYSRVLQSPEIAVIVREFASQKVYVGGEVANPGIIALNQEMTALEAIVSAGGFRETAEPKSVIVISRSPKNTRLVRTVNMQNVLDGVGTEQELLVKPFDVIYVPKTAVAKVDKFVDEFIRKMIPVNLTSGFMYTRYRDVR